MGRTPAGQTREKVFAFVRARLLAGQPPTVREVQEALGFRAVQTARRHLERLVTDGRLVVSRHQARGYRLARAEMPPRARMRPRLVPLVGRVPAGALEEAIEDPDGHLPAAGAHLADADEVFALRVRGESMIGAGILPGDLVIVRRQPTAEHGDIVVAMVDGEATVKRLKRVSARAIALHPENPSFEPLVLDPDRVVVLGKVVEVRRVL